ncbi:unnamed protein product, partial [Didymodactylos carnosus]
MLVFKISYNIQIRVLKKKKKYREQIPGSHHQNESYDEYGTIVPFINEFLSKLQNSKLIKDDTELKLLKFVLGRIPRVSVKLDYSSSLKQDRATARRHRSRTPPSTTVSQVQKYLIEIIVQ